MKGVRDKNHSKKTLKHSALPTPLPLIEGKRSTIQVCDDSEGHYVGVESRQLQSSYVRKRKERQTRRSYGQR